MKISILLKAQVEQLPPIISVCCCLADLGHDVSILTRSVSKETMKLFQQKKIKVIEYKGSNLNKVINWLKFKKSAWSFIKNINFDLLWIASADTALSIGKNLLKYKYIFQIHELYDTNSYYKRHIEIYAQKAMQVIVPEEVRAHIFRAWYRLKKNPVVLPNKPYYHPRKRNLEITDKLAKDAFNKISPNSKIIFYQGLISKDRDLTSVAKAIKNNKYGVVFAIQGKICDRNYFNDLINKYDVHYIPFVNPPNHLEITSNIDIGIVTYNHIYLNNEFCAPNKIYEYAGFGIPILANDVFSLKKVLSKYEFGISLNFDEDIKSEPFMNLINKLINEKKYSSASKEFFDSVDIKKIIEETLK